MLKVKGVVSIFNGNSFTVGFICVCCLLLNTKYPTIPIIDSNIINIMPL